MLTKFTSKYSNDECNCEKSTNTKQLIIDNLTETRTLLRCYRCRGIVGWWDHETEEQQEARIKKFNEEHPDLKRWTQEELDKLFRATENKITPPKREWTKTEMEELV